MAVLGIQVSNTGQVPNTTGMGIGMAQQTPTTVTITTNDTLATVLTTGYLNDAVTYFQYPLNNFQMAEVKTSDEGVTWLRVSVTYVNNTPVYSLVAPSEATTDVVTFTGVLTPGNLVTVNNASGIVQDAAVAPAALQLKSTLKAGLTAAYGGGGTSNAFTATGLAAGWIVTATILASTNSVAVTKAVAGTNLLTITFSADPGAGTTVQWIALAAAQ